MAKDKRTDEEIQADEEKKILADEDRIKRLQEATDAADAASKRLLEIETRVKMGGRSQQSTPEVKKEFTAQEYVDLVMAGKIPEQQK